MFDPVNEPSFRLEIAGQPQPFAVVAFSGSESISQPFAFQLDLLLDELRLDIASLMFRSAYLGFGGAGAGIHGQIHDLTPLHDGVLPGLWRLSLGPKLACLAQRFNQRIFTGLSVPQILVQVLREHGIDEKACRFELGSDYPVRDFCTQYRESDLAFLQRLCEQERIHYHFQHRKHAHCLIFADTQRSLSLAVSATVDAQSIAPAVRRFTVHAPADVAGHEGLPKPVAEGETDLPNLRSGMLMPLAGHSCADWNHLWLLTRVEHSGSQAQVPFYQNRIGAIPWETPFAAPSPGAKPRMSSVQRGWVVEVDEERADVPQRIAVQFDWLYQGEGARPSHCWLPVSPQLSAKTIAALTAGAEVCVSFIEGDPDQPLITGVFGGGTFGAETVLPAEESPPLVNEPRLQLQISATTFAGEGQCVELSSGQVLTFDSGTRMNFKVGSSEVRFEGADIRLSSPQISLKAIEQAPIGEPIPPLLEELSPVGRHDLLTLVQSSQPLVLLCLLPGGGSFTFCQQAICVCRTVAGLGQSGAA